MIGTKQGSAEGESGNRSDLPGDTYLGCLHTTLLTPTGFEHPAESRGNRTVARKRGAESGAPAAAGTSDIAALVAAWPKLPKDVRAAIGVLLRTAKP
jgi:hypothetical protein